jgi:hypothetical protein
LFRHPLRSSTGQRACQPQLPLADLPAQAEQHPLAGSSR